MSTYIKMQCACGAVETDVDIYDAELNRDQAGSTITCSQSCKSIREARLSWLAEFSRA